MGWPDGWTDLALREPVPVPTGWGEDWEGDVPRTVTGVPHRTSRLKALGNGQVPQAAAAAWLMLTQKSRLTSGRQVELSGRFCSLGHCPRQMDDAQDQG